MDQKLHQKHANGESDSAEKRKYYGADVHQGERYKVTLLSALGLGHVHLLPQSILHARLLNSNRPAMRSTMQTLTKSIATQSGSSQ